MCYHCNIVIINNNEAFCDSKCGNKRRTFFSSQAHFSRRINPSLKQTKDSSSDRVNMQCENVMVRWSSRIIAFRSDGRLDTVSMSCLTDSSANCISSTTASVDRAELGASTALDIKSESTEQIFVVVPRRPATDTAMLKGSAIGFQVTGFGTKITSKYLPM